jgi:hypothetical protein
LRRAKNKEGAIRLYVLFSGWWFRVLTVYLMTLSVVQAYVGLNGKMISESLTGKDVEGIYRGLV